MSKSKTKRDSYIGFRLPKILYDWVQNRTQDELKTMSEFLNQMVKTAYDEDADKEEEQVEKK